MRFTKKITLAAAETTPNPRSAPATIASKAVFVTDAYLTNASSSPRRTLVSLEGTVADTATVRFWILDDAGFGEPPDAVNYATANWYSLGNTVVLTVGASVVAEALPAGAVYVEVTVGPINAAVVKIGPAP